MFATPAMSMVWGLYVVTRGMQLMVSLSLVRKLSSCVGDSTFLIPVKTFPLWLIAENDKKIGIFHYPLLKNVCWWANPPKSEGLAVRDTVTISNGVDVLRSSVDMGEYRWVSGRHPYLCDHLHPWLLWCSESSMNHWRFCVWIWLMVRRYLDNLWRWSKSPWYLSK